MDAQSVIHNLSQAGWWAQAYLQFIGGCSLVVRGLTPLEEWSHDEAPRFFSVLHPAMELLRKYASLNVRPNLPGLRKEDEK